LDGAGEESPGARRGTLHRDRGVAFVARLLAALLILLAAVGFTPASGQETGGLRGDRHPPGGRHGDLCLCALEEPVLASSCCGVGRFLLTVEFGGLGEGVCKIEQTGCEIGPCRTRLCQGRRDSPYGAISSRRAGAWVASPLGGSATRIAPATAWMVVDADEALLPE